MIGAAPDRGLDDSQAGARSIGLGVENLTNAKIGVQGFDLATLCGCNEVSYKPPRTFVVKTRYSF